MNMTSRFLEGFTPDGKIVKQKYSLNELGNISSHLKSRQVIRLTCDELYQLAEDPDSWFHENDRQLISGLKTSTTYSSEYDFSTHNDGYDISEYVGKIEKYHPNLYYLWWAINNNSDILVNVYDAYSLYDYSIRNEMLKDKIVGINKITHGTDDERMEIPKDTFNIPLTEYEYVKFQKPVYSENVLIPTLEEPVTILSVNIPYEVYSRQLLPINTYTYDIDLKKYMFGSKTREEFMELVMNIANNGITNPLFLRLHGQTLTCPDEEGSLILLAAMLLKLPTIPVHVYLSNEYDATNDLFDDVYNLSPKHQFYSNPIFINKYFGRKIIVYPTNITDEALNNLSNAYSFNVCPEVNRDEFMVVRRFDSKLNDEYASRSISADDGIAEIQAKVHDEINQQIEKLNRRADRYAANSQETSSVEVSVNNSDSE